MTRVKCQPHSPRPGERTPRPLDTLKRRLPVLGLCSTDSRVVSSWGDRAGGILKASHRAAAPGERGGPCSKNS